MNSVYLTNTPYHIIISCGLASLYDNNAAKKLIIVNDFKDAVIFKEIIANWEKNPFSDIMLLSGRYGINKEDKWEIALNARSNVRTLKRMSEKIGRDTHISERLTRSKVCDPLVPPYHLFIFNDQNPEAQCLAFLNNNCGGINTCVEDGFAAYGVSTSHEMPRYQKIIAKILWGTFYERVNVLGTYQFIHKIMVFKPKYTRTELERNKLIQLPEDVLLALNQNGFTTACLDKYSLEKYGAEKSDCTLILPLSDDLDKCHFSKFNSVIDIILASYSCFNAKYHPRETHQDYLHLQEHYDNVKILPQAMPMEIIYLSLIDNEPKAIVGTNSTSIFTARIIFKNSKIISISKILYGYDLMEDTYAHLDIFSPATLEEFRDLL